METGRKSERDRHKERQREKEVEGEKQRENRHRQSERPWAEQEWEAVAQARGSACLDWSEMTAIKAHN